MRILVAGRPDAGKTTTARAIAAIYGIPHCEVDVLRRRARRVHDADAKEVLSEDLRQHCERPEWVIDGTWNRDPTLRREMMQRADRIVYLDLPFRTTELRAWRRHVVSHRRLHLRFVRRRIKKARKHRERKKRLEADLSTHPVKAVRLRSPQDIDRYLSRLRAQALGW